MSQVQGLDVSCSPQSVWTQIASLTWTKKCSHAVFNQQQRFVLSDSVLSLYFYWCLKDIYELRDQRPRCPRSPLWWKEPEHTGGITYLTWPGTPREPSGGAAGRFWVEGRPDHFVQPVVTVTSLEKRQDTDGWMFSCCHIVHWHHMVKGHYT